MSGVPISAPEPMKAVGDWERLLLSACEAFEAGDRATAAALWHGPASTALATDWPSELDGAVGGTLRGIAHHLDRKFGKSEACFRHALSAWEAVPAWLACVDLPSSRGGSTPAHFRRQRSRPGSKRAAALGQLSLVAVAARAATLNALAETLRERGRPAEALPFYREAASLRRQGLGWREAGLARILGNLLLVERETGGNADTVADELRAIETAPVPAGSRRFVEVSAGTSGVARMLLAAVQLVPILPMSAGDPSSPTARGRPRSGGRRGSRARPGGSARSGSRSRRR